MITKKQRTISLEKMALTTTDDKATLARQDEEKDETKQSNDTITRKKVKERGITYNVLETKWWRAFYLNGKRHREHFPALIWHNKMTAYFRKGALHRNPNQGEAMLYANKEKFFFERGIQKINDKPLDSTNMMMREGINQTLTYLKKREARQ